MPDDFGHESLDEVGGRRVGSCEDIDEGDVGVEGMGVISLGGGPAEKAKGGGGVGPEVGGAESGGDE